MDEMQDKQPGVEGSTAKEVTEGVSGESMDAAPAEKHDSTADGAAPSSDEAARAIADAFAGGDVEKDMKAIEEFVSHSEYMARIQSVAEPAKPALSDELKAKVERIAAQYGFPHFGDHADTAKRIGDLWGHFHDDLVSLVGKLCAHAGI